MFEFDEPGPNWFEIPESTMKELRARGRDRAKFNTQQFAQTGQIGMFGGMPVHRVGNKWYVKVTAGDGGPSYAQTQDMIKQVRARLHGQGRGAWKYHWQEDGQVLVWDGLHWISASADVFGELDIPLTEESLSLPEVRRLEAHIEVLEGERERLELRQLLAETQAGEDEEDEPE